MWGGADMWFNTAQTIKRKGIYVTPATNTHNTTAYAAVRRYCRHHSASCHDGLLLMQQDEQQFLNGLEKKLWTSANKLLPSLDASQYKHVMLGLIFLKYVSDSFGIRRVELTEQFKNPDQEYFLDPADFDGEDSKEYQAEIDNELELLQKENVEHLESLKSYND